MYIVNKLRECARFVARIYIITQKCIVLSYSLHVLCVSVCMLNTSSNYVTCIYVNGRAFICAFLVCGKQSGAADYDDDDAMTKGRCTTRASRQTHRICDLIVLLDLRFVAVSALTLKERDFNFLSI